MARLIDADHLRQIVCSATILSDGFKDVFCRLVAGEPTIDSPTSSQFKRMAVQMGYEPVVYCKNCKHRDPEDKRCDCGCWHIPFTTNDNDFCRYGEWRTNANEPDGA